MFTAEGFIISQYRARLQWHLHSRDSHPDTSDRRENGDLAMASPVQDPGSEAGMTGRRRNDGKPPGSSNYSLIRNDCYLEIGIQVQPVSF